MKRYVLTVAILASLVAGCSFERRSQQFACDTSAECSGGRVCDRGWCVETVGAGDGGVVDGGPASDAGFVCPAECSKCDLDTCVMLCDAADACAEQVVCPPGIPCKVECNGENACAGGIDCTAARSCRIECIQSSTCGGAIACGAGVCRVECSGAGSCTGGIDCAGSCLCDTLCTGLDSCAPPPMCPGPGQCTSGIECTSAPGQCNTC